MARAIYVPQAGGFIDFSDTASDEDIKSYIRAKYPKPQPVAAPAPEEAAATSDDSSVLGRFAYGLGTGITDIPGGIAALFYPSEEATKTSAGQISEQSRKYLQETFGIDPTKDPTTAQWLAETLGSAASFLVPGGAVAKGAALAGKGAALAGRGAALAGRAGTLTAAGQGVALGAEARAEQIRQQLSSGMEISEAQQLASQRLSGFIGAAEAAPMAKFFGPLTTILSKVPASKAGIVEKIISNRLAKVTKAGVQEAAQEVASGIANDLMEYGVYNPDVQIGQDLLSNAAGGAFAGSTLEGIIQLAAGRKLRGARQLQKDLDAEKQANAAELRQAYIAQDADNLLASGVRGEVSIDEEEDPAGFTKFVLKDTVGTPIAEYESLDAAQKVIDLYKQKSGIDVSVREPGVEPTPAPGPAVPAAPKVELKVGKRKFASVDDILAEKKKHTDEIAKISVFKNNPELLVKQAKAQGVAPGVYAKDLDIKIAKNQAQVSKYDQYINSLQQPPAEPAKAPPQPIKAAGPLVTPKTAITPEAVAVPEAPAQPAVEAIRAKEQEIKADTFTEAEPSEQAAPEVPEIVEPEAIAPEIPIGAVEMPVEESRVLPDEIVDIETKPTPVSTEEEAPPQDLNVPLSAGITGQTAPRNMREAVVTGPVVKDYSPETQEWMSKVYTGLMNRLSPIVPTEASVNLKTLIDQGPGYLVRGQVRPEQTPDGMKTVIDLSTGILKPGMSVEDAINTLADTMNHEIIHVLRDKGVIRPSEWKILSRAATSTNVPGKKYTYLDKVQAIYAPIGPNGEPVPMSEVYANPDAVVEEAVAEMYRNWVKDRAKPPQPAVGLFNRITEFFRRIFQTLRNARHQEVFEAIQSGEVGKREGSGRERTEMLSAGPSDIVNDVARSPDREDYREKITTRMSFPRSEIRFSAAPLPPYVAQQNSTMFAQVPNTPVKDRIFSYFFDRGAGDKTIQTMSGPVTLSSTKMKAIAGRAALVDKSALITEIEKISNQQRTGNYQRETADFSATAAIAWRRRSSQVFAGMMLRGNLKLNYARPGDIQSATMKIEDDQDNLKNIFGVLLQEGPINPTTNKPDTKMDIFRSYAVARRGEWLRSTGQTVPNELTPRYIRETVDLTQREYPEVIEAYNSYQRFNKKLLKTAKDAGLISDAELARLTNQMNYYGFIYEVYGEPLGPTSAQKTASKFKLRPYTGSVRGGLASDPMYVMIQNAQFWVDSIAKNLAATKSYKLLSEAQEARLLGSSESPDESRGEAPDIMYFSDNGTVKRFAVKDPLLAIALGSDDRADLGKFWEIVGFPTNVLRESVTRDPGFMARNLMRDTLSAWITSGADFVPVIGTLRGFGTALKDGASFKALSSFGVVGSYDLAMLGPAELAAKIRQNAMPKNVYTVATRDGAIALGKTLWSRLGAVSEASDAATRIAVYDAAIKQGMSEAEAAMQAIELLDFTRRGASQALGILTKLIPFLNARIQGMDVLYQAGRSGIRYITGQTLGERDANIGKNFILRGSILAIISVALEMWNKDDEDYQQLDEYIKTGNLLFPLAPFGLKGEFIAFPKPFESGLLFSTFPQQIYKTTIGEASTRENADLFWSQISATFGVNPIPQVLLPAYEIITNHSFYTGLPLISEGKARLAPELQYNTSTSQLAMMIGGIPIFYNFDTGKFTGLSPIVVDKIISGYGGPLGTYLAQGISLGMEDFNVGPDRMPRELSNLPIVKSFFVDAKSKNPKVVTQAYELFKIADEANRTMSRLRQMQDAEALANYIDENKDILRYKKYIFTVADRLNKLSAQERAIERDQSMTRDEKLAAQEKLREIRIRITSQISKINEDIGR